MNSIATSHDEALGARAAVGSGHRDAHWPRHPPDWLWAGMIALQLGAVALLTSYTYFFFDDFLFLQQARTQHFGVSYLRDPLFEHFSPVTRIFNTFLVHVAPGSFALAHGVQLALYTAAILAFALVARTVLGNRWTAFVLTILFGQSVFLIRLLDWWTATANTLPSTVCMLLAIAGYLRWRIRGSRGWLLLSLGAFAVSLLDYETAMLFPVYLLLISLLVMEDRFSPGAWLEALRRDRWTWLAYGALEILALYNYYEYYYQKVAKPTLDQLTHYLWIAFVETFVPAIIGIDPEAPLRKHAVVIAAAVIVVGLAVALTLYFRPRAWRCLLAFVVLFPVTMLPVGLNRIGQFGVGVAAEVRYQQAVQFMFMVLAAFALSTRWGGQRPTSDRGRRWVAAHKPSTVMIAAVATVAVVGYGTLYVTSVHAMAKAAREPREAHAYIGTFLAGVHHVEALTGRQPDFVDHQVPPNIQFASFTPFNRYDQLFGMFDSKLRIDQIADPAYFVTGNGQLLPVHFVVSARGILRTSTISAPNGTDVIPASSSPGSPACVPPGWTAARMHITLSVPRVTSPRATGLPYALRVHYRMPVRAPVEILLGNSTNVVLDEGFSHVWGPGEGGELAPLSVATQVDQVDLELPANACVTDLSFGSFTVAGSPIP
jgi:hypothetical protein